MATTTFDEVITIFDEVITIKDSKTIKIIKENINKPVDYDKINKYPHYDESEGIKLLKQFASNYKK